MGERIVDGLAYRTLEKDLGSLVLEPYFKRMKDRERKTHAKVLSLVVCQVLVIGLAFDLIQEANLFYGALRACRVMPILLSNQRRVWAQQLRHRTPSLPS